MKKIENAELRMENAGPGQDAATASADAGKSGIPAAIPSSNFQHSQFSIQHSSSQPAAFAPARRRGVNRASSLAQMPPEIYAQFVRWFRAGRGYRQILADLNPLIDAHNAAEVLTGDAAVPHISLGAISRWWKAVEGPAAKEAAARACDVEKFKAQLEAGLQDGDASKAIINFAEMIVLKRSGSLEDVPIKDLGYLLTSLQNAKARQFEIDLQRSRLAIENEKLQMAKESAERELAKQREEEERKRQATERLLAATGADSGDKTAAVVGKIKEIWGFK